MHTVNHRAMNLEKCRSVICKSLENNTLKKNNWISLKFLRSIQMRVTWLMSSEFTWRIPKVLKKECFQMRKLVLPVDRQFLMLRWSCWIRYERGAGDLWPRDFPRRCLRNRFYAMYSTAWSTLPKSLALAELRKRYRARCRFTFQLMIQWDQPAMLLAWKNLWPRMRRESFISMIELLG